jgi:hypothetical protein
VRVARLGDHLTRIHGGLPPRPRTPTVPPPMH